MAEVVSGPGAVDAAQVALKRKLVRRMIFAGGMIAALLGALAVFDQLSQPELPAPVPRVPVPQPRQEIAKPVETPAAESPPPAVLTPAAPVASESSSAPITTLAERPTEPTPPPAIAAQPRLPAPTSPAPAAVSAPRRVLEAAPERTAAPDMAPVVSVPEPARVPAPPPRLSTGYVVQAGVFASAQHAEALFARLQSAGIPATIETRVAVGPFKSRREAQAAHEKMRAMGIDGLLLPPRDTRR
jgi:cell division protein FtsN